MTRDAFNDIIYKYNRKFFAIAFRMLHNRQEAEDVVQDVFLKMWAMGAKLDEYLDKGALGVTMTKNSCLDMLRRWKHIDSEQIGSEIVSSDTAPSPFDKMTMAEDASIIGQIIEELPPLYRDLVRLREINGMSYEEIASLNNTNINTLRVALSRARKMIREKYLKYTDERE